MQISTKRQNVLQPERRDEGGTSKMILVSQNEGCSSSKCLVAWYGESSRQSSQNCWTHSSSSANHRLPISNNRPLSQMPDPTVFHGTNDASSPRARFVSIDVPPTPATKRHSPTPKSQSQLPTTTNNNGSRHQHHSNQSQGQSGLASILSALDQYSPSQPLEYLNSCPESICGGFPGP
jgi:hypothetical protein